MATRVVVVQSGSLVAWWPSQGVQARRRETHPGGALGHSRNLDDLLGHAWAAGRHLARDLGHGHGRVRALWADRPGDRDVSCTLIGGDCLPVLRQLPDNSIDAVVTDPPYGLRFMGRKWDYDVPGTDIWAECLRVLKPGGHLLAFAGTRTQHRMCVRIEDAGFEIRDMIAWVYGGGFPKSHNLKDNWEGWGSALKPAMEPITVARKTLSGTLAANVSQYGVGSLNIDGCRVETADNLSGGAYAKSGRREISSSLNPSGMNRAGAVVGKAFVQPTGRWPANVIHDGSDEVRAIFPDAPGQQGALTGAEPSGKMGSANCYGKMDRRHACAPREETDRSAARFFYCAKASKVDRNEGLIDTNKHPTVKPTDLMRYLCRLVTPPGGVVLDPFMGSGSTGKAALLEGLKFIGIERELEHLKVAQERIEHAASIAGR
jgi:hypothetical protein